MWGTCACGYPKRSENGVIRVRIPGGYEALDVGLGTKSSLETQKSFFVSGVQRENIMIKKSDRHKIKF